MKKNLKIFLIAFCVITIQNVSAQTLFLYCTDGSMDQYLINEIQKMTFSNDTLNIAKTNGNIDSKNINDIRKFTFPNYVSVLKNQFQTTSNDWITISPNPAKDEVSINFCLEKVAVIEIDIYNITGELIKQIVHSEYGVGNFSVKWNSNCEYRETKGGLYICKAIKDGIIESKKLIIVK